MEALLSVQLILQLGNIFPFLRTGTGFSRNLQFSCVSIIPPVLNAHISFVYHIIYRITLATASVFLFSTKDYTYRGMCHLSLTIRL